MSDQSFANRSDWHIKHHTFLWKAQILSPSNLQVNGNFDLFWVHVDWLKPVFCLKSRLADHWPNLQPEHFFCDCVAHNSLHKQSFHFCLVTGRVADFWKIRASPQGVLGPYHLRSGTNLMTHSTNTLEHSFTRNNQSTRSLAELIWRLTQRTH